MPPETASLEGNSNSVPNEVTSSHLLVSHIPQTLAGSGCPKEGQLRRAGLGFL